MGENAAKQTRTRRHTDGRRHSTFRQAMPNATCNNLRFLAMAAGLFGIPLDSRQLEHWQSNRRAAPTPAADTNDVITSQCKPTRPTGTAPVNPRCNTLLRVDIHYSANANGVGLDRGNWRLSNGC